MKRIQLILAALAIVVTSLAAFAGPAMAQDIDCNIANNQPEDIPGNIIRCDNGDLYAPFDRDYYNNIYDSPYPYPDFSYPYPDFSYPDYSQSFYDEDYWEEVLDELD